MLTEMSTSSEGEFFVLCFRPMSTGDAPEKKRVCCYSEVEITQAMDSARSDLLTEAIVSDMNERLAGLYESAR